MANREGGIACTNQGKTARSRLDDRSWVNREIHAQICEGQGLRCPWLLDFE